VIEFSIKNLRFINYFFAALLLAAILLLTRDVITTTVFRKQPKLLKKATNSSVQATLPKKSLMQYSPILEKNPFGSPMELHPISVSQTGGQETGDASLSNLVLYGPAVGSKNFGYAIFEDKSQAQGRQELFSVGEHVFGYGILKKIHRSSVEIERNAGTFTVTIPDETVIESGYGQELSRETPQAQSSFARQVGEREYILDSRKIQQSLDNPEQILTDARLLPNIKDGRQEGFSISEVVPGGIYHSLGLRNGDILLRINGLEISNPEVAIQAISALKGMNNINLDIMRNNQNMSMNYRIK
jgi:general secretion pathway protein C